MIGCAPSSEKVNLQIAKQLFDAFNAHDWTKMAAFYSQDAEFLDPAFGSYFVNKSQQEIIEKYGNMEKIFPNINDEVNGMYAANDKVTVEFISTGSSGDSIKFRLPICSILTFKDGKIVRDATYYDNQ
jgi:ketosteroid isomerase-like protein